MPYTSQGYMTAADMAEVMRDMDLLPDPDESEPDPECEAKGCDIPEGYPECRRCGAELDEDED